MESLKYDDFYRKYKNRKRELKKLVFLELFTEKSLSSEEIYNEFIKFFKENSNLFDNLETLKLSNYKFKQQYLQYFYFINPKKLILNYLRFNFNKIGNKLEELELGEFSELKTNLDIFSFRKASTNYIPNSVKNFVIKNIKIKNDKIYNLPHLKKLQLRQITNANRLKVIIPFRTKEIYLPDNCKTNNFSVEKLDIYQCLSNFLATEDVLTERSVIYFYLMSDIIKTHILGNNKIKNAEYISVHDLEEYSYKTNDFGITEKINSEYLIVGFDCFTDNYTKKELKLIKTIKLKNVNNISLKNSTIYNFV